MSKLGYHINLNGLRQQSEEAQENTKSTGAPFHLITTTPPNGINTEDEITLIDEWAKILYPAQIIWHTYSKLDGDWSVFPSNDEIMRRWLDENRPQYIRDDPANEPALLGNDPSTNSRYVKSRADLLQMATAAGIKVAVGAFRSGTPSRDLIADGTYDELIRAVVEGEHYFSVHEYCPGIPGAGDIFPYEQLLLPETVKDAIEPDTWSIQADYRHLRRSDHFVLRARELGLSDPQIIVTRAFVDFIPHANEVLEQLKDKYGIPAYDKDLRGILSWRMYYADVFPEKPFSQVVAELCKYIEDNVYYPEYIKGVCLFSLDWEQDIPEAHNFLDPFLDNFRREGLPNLANQQSILSRTQEPSDADTISTRSPEFWEKLREEIAEISLNDDEHDMSEDGMVDNIHQETTRSTDIQDESVSSARISSTVEIPAVALEQLNSRWQDGTFHSEGVRIRVAPFTDSEPIGQLLGEKTGQQHIGDIQSDGYTWRWIRFVHEGKVIEGYAASAFYEFRVN